MDHLEDEVLSALVDDELAPAQLRDAQAHLAACAACAASAAAFAQLDHALAAPVPLGCGAALELRSGLLDGELSAGEAAVASAHLARCGACRADQAAWSAVRETVRTLPAAMPSLGLDERIARLTAPAARRRVPLAGSGVAFRGALSAAVVLAVVVGLLPAGRDPSERAAEAPIPEHAFVAGVQQFVLYAPTNTLYVLQPQAGAVDAMDGASHALRTRIHVGGRPTALALNEPASRVIVLDAGQRSLVEIDAREERVVATTTLPLGGRPTSLAVDPSTGRIIVAAIPDPPIGGPAPTPTVGSDPGRGSVAVIDPTTMKVETLRSLEVAPQLVITDGAGKRTLLVSTSATTLVDESYRAVRTLPGGVAAAFSARAPFIAILAADSGSAILQFSGDGAPGPLRLPGIPLAVTSVPGVGFAALLGSGGGSGRIVVVDEAGRAVGSTDVTEAGRDLAYDAASRRFTVLGRGSVASAPLPAGLLALATTRPEPSPSLTPRPSAERTPSAAPAASPTPPQTTSAPAAPAQPSVNVVAASPSPRPAGVPSNAAGIADGLYRVDLGGRTPVLVAATLRRIWFTDTANGLDALDLATGAVFTLAQFPRGAETSALVARSGSVHAIDARSGRLFTFDIATELLSSREVPLLRGATALAVGGDGRLWLGTERSGEIVSFDPVSGRTELVPTSARGIAAIAMDSSSKVWFSDGARLVGNYDLITRRVTELIVPGKGSARVLLPGSGGLVWVGTTAGEVIAASDVDATARVVGTTGQPIARLTMDSRGVIWYLTPAAPGRGGYLVGRAGASEPHFVPGAAGSLDFSLGNRAWIADVTGGFFVALWPSK